MFIRTKIKHFQLVLWGGGISAQPFTPQQKENSVIRSSARWSRGPRDSPGNFTVSVWPVK